MKNIRRLIGITILSMVLLAGGIKSFAAETAPAAAATENPGDKVFSGKITSTISYTFDNTNNKGLLTISGTGKMNNLFKKLNEKKAPGQVKKRAFQQYAKDVKKLVIEEGITYVGNGYFAYLNNLTTVQINGKKGKVELGNSSFLQCKKLKKVSLKGVSKIGYGCFARCTKLKDIDLEFCDGLKSLGNYAFYQCKAARRFEFPTSMKSVGYACFYQCGNVKEFIFGGKLNKCGEFAFYKAGSKKKHSYISYPGKVPAKLKKEAKRGNLTIKSQ
ncbi:MAG: leucine-rich repeat domain-containing protein [Eubacterium sp.]|nr:leucine-rich repeat domain-containing protein [Eubacterium sp.]